MPCLQLSTNAYLELPQMPVGVPNTFGAWFKVATLGAFGEVFLSETSTPDNASGDVKGGADSAHFFLSSKFDGRTDGSGSAPSTSAWYFLVLSSEDSSNHRFRVYSDNGPTFTKLEDVTRSFSGTDKRYASITATSGTIRVTAGFAHYGGVMTDTEIRAKLATRSLTTPAAGTMWDAYGWSSHSDLTGANGNNATGGGTIATDSGDEPAALTAGATVAKSVFQFLLKNG